ncbi:MULTISPECIES: UDP-N-acetylmuramate dehydrogenase [Enorma]|uniref:UDP-N-acetylmuramate dehydrogenase n=1 Tax=Enorma TaxID=1472762 RepID=UPI00034DDEB8|nr:MULTISPECIES: UDP-N-acetylmuramate dehydrogenase [Enorma]
MHEYSTMSDEVICALGAAVGEDNVLLAEPMSAHTTFKIGGSADAVVLPRTPEAAARALDVCAIADVPVTVVGNGSDLLVGDRGIRGVVVLLRENLSDVRIEGTRVHAQAGALLRDVALAAADAGLSGMEPLWGIPAAVGGACHQNAGAYDACIADVLETLTAYVPGAVLPDGSRGKGSVRTFGRDELAFGYRESRVATDGLVVLEAVFALVPDMEASIRARMDDYQRRREEKQPLELPSAGSTFKRPAGYFAGKLIMDAGLRGCRVGGAQVSEKHCGFVVNTGGATAADVNALIEHVQAEVREQFGVELEPEVHRIGEF